MEKTSAKFFEEGDEVLLEVEGQSTEFSEHDVLSENNNATPSQGRSVSKGKEVSMDEMGDEVRELPINGEQQRIAEEADMMKLMEFMRKQGLVFMDTNGAQTAQTALKKINEVHWGKSQKLDIGDDLSVVTVYQKAVQKEPTKNRDSSSTDENMNFSPMDTSDEYEQMNNDWNFNQVDLDIAGGKSSQQILTQMNVMQQMPSRLQAHCSAYVPMTGFQGHNQPQEQERELIQQMRPRMDDQQMVPRVDQHAQMQLPELSRAEQLIREAEAS